MKYRDKEIGTPTIEQVVEYCQRMKFQFSPYDCYAHYKAQDFKTNKISKQIRTWSLKHLSLCVMFTMVLTSTRERVEK